MRRFFKLYFRVLGFLREHKLATASLCLANVALAGIGFMEPVLFGHVVQGLGESGPSSAYLLPWAGLGLLGIAAGMATSLVADRLSHRLRLHAMDLAYANVLRLPPDYHARYPSGGLMKQLWSGADELKCLWLGLFHDHLITALCLIGMLPIALYINPVLGAVLVVLALGYR